MTQKSPKNASSNFESEASLRDFLQDWMLKIWQKIHETSILMGARSPYSHPGPARSQTFLPTLRRHIGSTSTAATAIATAATTATACIAT